jgi:Mor family transcriptional regulator
MLYTFVENAHDGRHAATILLESGLIKEESVRDLAIIRDFDIMYKNPLSKIMDIYYNLSAKYDLSVNHVRKIISERR